MSELQQLQMLTFASAPRPSAHIGEKGELRWLPLSQLFIDPAYQRSIHDSGKANIRRMIEEFSWAQFGACVVSRRGKDRYAVIDGQHRATAALNRGDIDSVPCLILVGGVAAEARAFAAINGNVTRIHPLQSFRAAVAGGDSEAVKIAQLCSEAGVSIANYAKNDLKPGETCALNAIRLCLKRHGPKSLVTALVILRAAFPQDGLPGMAVHALCDLAPRHPEWNRDAARIGGLLARSGESLAQLVSKARLRKATRGNTDWFNFAAIAESQIAIAARTSNVPMSRLMAGR